MSRSIQPAISLASTRHHHHPLSPRHPPPATPSSPHHRHHPRVHNGVVYREMKQRVPFGFYSRVFVSGLNSTKGALVRWGAFVANSHRVDWVRFIRQHGRWVVCVHNPGYKPGKGALESGRQPGGGVGLSAGFRSQQVAFGVWTAYKRVEIDLYTTDYCCSNVGLVDKIIRDPNPISYDETLDSPLQPQTSSLNQRHCFHCKDPLEEHEHCKRCTCMRCGSGLSKGFCFICASSNKNSSQRLPNCPKCGDPVEGLYCRQCALNRKKLEEVFQDFQDTFESSNNNTNVVNAPQEPFVVKQDPGVNSSQSPPHIDHHCCYECGDSLDDIFCQQCTCKSCGKGAHYGYNCPPKVPNLEPCNNQTVDELPQTLPSFDPTYYSGDGSSFTYDSTPNFFNDSPNKEEEKRIAEDQAAKDRYWKILICYDDEEDDTIAVTPVLLTEEPVDSLIMEDEHIDTITIIESDEVIKSSVENLVPI
ncbi:hypothetical protein Tco_0102927, partial [Tanacetum coccineum]